MLWQRHWKNVTLAMIYRCQDTTMHCSVLCTRHLKECGVSIWFWFGLFSLAVQTTRQRGAMSRCNAIKWGRDKQLYIKLWPTCHMCHLWFLLFSLSPSLSVRVCAFSFPFSYKDKQCPLGMSLLLVSSSLFPHYCLFFSLHCCLDSFPLPLYFLSSFVWSSCLILLSSLTVLCSPLFLFSYPLRPFPVEWEERHWEAECGRQRKKEREKGVTCPKKILQPQ